MSEYTKRDHTAQGEHYLRHVSAMTGEGLHTKSAIAGELAHRDIEIERLTDDYAAATHLLADRDAQIERLTKERDAANAELTLRRKSESASERLHNICEGISRDADGSEWSREEWEKLDADMLALRKELAAANAVIDKLIAALQYHQEQTRPIHSTQIALDAARALRMGTP